jgi:hypothetical protein
VQGGALQTTVHSTYTYEPKSSVSVRCAWIEAKAEKQRILSVEKLTENNIPS